MKNIIDICKDFGIEIPADKHAEFNKAVAENYKTIAEHEKKVNRLTDDLAAEKKRADDAVETLKGFEGKDFDAITRERDEWKTKHDNAVTAHQKEQEAREFNEMLKTELDALTFSSGAARKAVEAEIRAAGLKAKNGKILGLSDMIEQLKKDDASAFVDTKNPPARFDDPGNKGNPAGTLTREDIMKISDRAERRATMAKNQHLF